jgi:AcrR family transcriptional regulator
MLGSKIMKIRVTKKAPDAYQHGDLREALIDAGVKLLMEGGVDKLSLRGAAQLAGVSHAAPYRHYRDKDALIAAIAERGFRMLTAAMHKQLEGTAKQGVAKLAALGVGYVLFGTQHPAYLQIIFGSMRSHKDMPPELMTAGMESYLVLREAVAEGISSGALRRAEIDEVALACWSLVHGLSMLIIHGAVPKPETLQLEAKLTERLLGILAQGIASVAADGG